MVQTMYHLIRSGSQLMKYFFVRERLLFSEVQKEKVMYYISIHITYIYIYVMCAYIYIYLIQLSSERLGQTMRF